MLISIHNTVVLLGAVALLITPVPPPELSCFGTVIVFTFIFVTWPFESLVTESTTLNESPVFILIDLVDVVSDPIPTDGCLLI